MVPTVKAIDALLPQTQCGECGFSGCLPYAEALAQKSAAINKCPPGGVETVKALATQLGVNPTPYLDTKLLKTRLPALAVIREDECIGCTKCIQACPVDAIIGSGKFMHSILATECTGCGLCVDPCPVDCIDLLPIPVATYQPEKARARYQARQIRQIQKQNEQQQRYRDQRQLALNTIDEQKIAIDDDKKAKQAYILAALARANQRKKT